MQNYKLSNAFVIINTSILQNIIKIKLMKIKQIFVVVAVLIATSFMALYIYDF